MTYFLMSYDKNEAVCCINQSLGSSCLLFVLVVIPVDVRYIRGEHMCLLSLTI
jgi:hypothetical protein